MKTKCYLIFIFSIFILLGGCNPFASQNPEPILFELLPTSKTNIDFQNILSPTEDLNTYTYRNFYNGGGVAIGDINNDNLPDVYLTGNQVQNRLYLNKGNFKFEDITEKAGVGSPGVWSTGVSMADVNGDGWLDIYVCKSGPPGGKNRKNDLFINNGDLTFTEKASEYGLAVEGLSVHASFLDYDVDGDLDMYLVSNPIRSFSNAEMVEGSERQNYDSEGGNRLFRNNLVSADTRDVNGWKAKFTDVTKKAGIYSSKIGFGLGVNAADLNRDGWPDLYISNDFFERDYLYLNNRDGTFREVLEKSMSSISLSSMGGDIADLNHDGYPEIFISDMRGGTEERLKTNTKYSSWKEYSERIKKGYFYQFERNTLQLNHGPSGTDDQIIPYFSEISRLAEIEGTDWSWGALVADFNIDGEGDIFVPNGIYKDLLNQDYLSKMSDPRAVRSVLKKQQGILKLVDMIPSTPVPNVLFKGSENLSFENKTDAWGVSKPSFSNGAAYGDLDNDGDLDLIVNNVNMETFIYRNQAANIKSRETNWINVVLNGSPPNTFGVGAQVTAWAGEQRWYLEQQPVRGFQSSVSPVLHIGLGNVQELDSLFVRWPDGTWTNKYSINVNQTITLSQSDSVDIRVNSTLVRTVSKVSGDSQLLKEVSPKKFDLNWKHRENEFNDFDQQPLLFHMRSTEGPPSCIEDVNKDGLDDLFLGGAKDQPSALFLQQPGSKFERSIQPDLEEDRLSEDTACKWFDANNDGFMDLYVGSGGSEFPASSSALADRLYLNNGGKLERAATKLIPPIQGFRPTGAVDAADYDGDGDFDLFVGERLRPFATGVPVDGYILLNDGQGEFRPAEIPSLKKIGMITDAKWFDHDNDGDPDLWIVGEWMPISVFENRDGSLVNVTEQTGLDSTHGWWQSLTFADLDGDGDKDFIGGNHGLNSIFQAGKEQPVELWAGDLDKNGTLEQVLGINKPEGTYPVALREDLANQIPTINSKYPDYNSFAGQRISEIFKEQQLEDGIHLRAYQMASVVAWNHGDGTFGIKPLPLLAQLAPLYGFTTADINADGITDLLAGGNLHAVKPQVGRYDATHGLVIQGDSLGKLQHIPSRKSGFFVKEEIRDINTIEINGSLYILVVRNDDELSIFKFQK